MRKLVPVKDQWDHCRAAEHTIKVIQKSIHGTASDDETSAVSNWDRKQRAVFTGERPLYHVLAEPVHEQPI